MKNRISLIALLLAVFMTVSCFAACKINANTPTTTQPSSDSKNEEVADTEEKETSSSSENGTSDNATSESNEDTKAESTVGGEASDTDADSAPTDTELDSSVQLEGEDDADLIELGDTLAGKVQSYYSDSHRDHFVIENSNMQLIYNMNEVGNMQVGSLTDRKGNTYISDTMDVFVSMKDGKTYYASNSFVNASMNIYRLGYYYYENRLENQVFVTDGFSKVDEINHLKIKKTTKVTNLGVNKDEGSIAFRIDDMNDPSVEVPGIRFNAADYGYLEITMKAHSGVTSQMEVFVIAGSQTNFTSSQRITQSIKADGKYHTYTIPLTSVADYNGIVSGLRLDVNGKPGGIFEIKKIRVLGTEEGSPQFLSLQRSYLSYSDKLHHLVQIAANQETKNIASVGILTEIDANTVDKLVIKDVQGLHYSLEDKIAWRYVQYVGFDINGVGVFGYIMPYDGKGGAIKVTLDSDRNVYVIEQTLVPDDYKISPSLEGKGNSNDVFLGSRIYTDNDHSFDKFIYEAECEVNPLKEENIVINPLKSGNASFNGYDSLRGYYKFTIDEAWGFNGPFFEYPNRHFGVEFTVKGDDMDRNCYILGYTEAGSLECAALLDEQRMMLPVPIQVGKNFKGDGENTIYNIDDFTYGEAILPFVVKAKSEDTFTLLHLYQNWGTFPLKQVSSIQFFSPYYHISVGTTETNCVVPYGTGGLSLPDFRSCSAPYWKNQPQHNSCGTHSFMFYNNSDGELIRNQHVSASIDSYGPTYAEMQEVFVSDDGKFRFTYNHMELPQTDENRTFYQFKVEILEDMSIDNFKEKVTFYSVKPNDPTGIYQRVGYLDENNQSQVVSANASGTPVNYKLGNNFPYFSFFDMDGYTSKSADGYSNVAMIIYDSEFTVGGEKTEADFMLRDMSGSLALTLDLEKVELRVGDTLVINGILLPWGSQEMENQYDSEGNLLDLTSEGKYFYDTVIDSETGAKYQDKNVRDVRLDSIVNAMKLTAGEDCERVDSVFLPRAKTTNGKSATFTVEGGANNIAVRVYGFEKLTVPVIEEQVNGEWVPYNVASVNKPDQQGYGYDYDGYTVYYDGDGTYSYAFAFATDGGEKRTFRITADKDFEGFGEEEDPFEDLPLNVYISSDNILSIGATLGVPFGVSKYENVVGEGYFRFYGNGINREAYVIPYTENSLYPTTGQYAVIKYRIPTTNSVSFSGFDFFSSTSKTGATGNGDWYGAYGTAIADGEWHVLVADLSSVTEYVANEDGTYRAKYMRFDVMNSSKTIAETDYIDIAYFGISDSLEDICKLNMDMDTIIFSQDKTVKAIDPKMGEVTIPKAPEDEKVPENDGKLDFVAEPEQIPSLMLGGCTATVSDEGDYARFAGKGAAEGYVFLFNDQSDRVTGQYLVIKYRVPVESAEKITNLEVFASTQKATAASGSSTQFGSIMSDGNWHVMIVDLTVISTYTDTNRKFLAKHVRIDIFNGVFADNCFVDIAYFGVNGSLTEILSMNTDFDTVTYIDKKGAVSQLKTDGSVEEPDPFEEVVIVVPPAGEETEKKTDTSALNVYTGADQIVSLTGNSGVSLELSEGGSYARVSGKGRTEGFIRAYADKDMNKVTGQYLAIKYRFYGDNALKSDCFDFYAATDGRTSAQGDGDHYRTTKHIQDGEWHVMIVDLSMISKFTSADGKYSASLVRIDLFNSASSAFGADSVVDIAYIAMDESLEDLYAINTDMSEIILVDANGNSVIDPSTGENVDG